VSQLYPEALGSLFVVSYVSQGYGEGIRSRLHTGLIKSSVLLLCLRHTLHRKHHVIEFHCSVLFLDNGRLLWLNYYGSQALGYVQRHTHSKPLSFSKINRWDNKAQSGREQNRIQFQSVNSVTIRSVCQVL
jgi:hypothetical protein